MRRVSISTLHCVRTPYRAVLDELTSSRAQKQVPQRRMLRKLRLQNLFHDSDIHVEPVPTLVPTVTARLLECSAGRGQLADEVGDVRSGRHELVCLEHWE